MNVIDDCVDAVSHLSGENIYTSEDEDCTKVAIHHSKWEATEIGLGCFRVSYIHNTICGYSKLNYYILFI